MDNQQQSSEMRMFNDYLKREYTQASGSGERHNGDDIVCAPMKIGEVHKRTALT